MPCVPTDRLQPHGGHGRAESESPTAFKEDDAARTILDLSHSVDLENEQSTVDRPMAHAESGHPSATPMDEFGFPDFFESIMNVPQSQPLPQPPDVSDFMLDFDLNAWDFDFSLLENGLTRASPPRVHVSAGALNRHQSVDTPRSDAELRSEAFKKSPWSWNHWIPPSNHGSFGGGLNEINVPQQRVQTSDQLTPPALRTHVELTTEARDRLLRLVSQMGESRVAIKSFPSFDLLQDLLDVCSIQETNAVHNFIHMASFEPKFTRTELLLAMVASGSTCIALTPVWRMGLVMQEVVRVAVGTSIEKDNAMTRDLQHLQAWLMMLNIGIWSGLRRKTEVASAFLQTSLTMLTWSNAFSRTRYVDIVPSWDDQDEELESKWKDWVKQESFKRLCIRYFIHDSQVSIAHLQNPLLSPAQLMLPLPAAKPLWTAQTAQTWRNYFLTSRQPKESQGVSCMALTGNIRFLDALDGRLDKNLAIMVACHSMAYDVFYFRQQALLLSHGQSRPRHDRLLAHLSRQKDIHDDLSSIYTYCELQPRPLIEALFTLHYLMMSLYVSLDDIQLFSGRSGEEEARRVYPQIRAWVEDSASKTTVWHAGQVLRMARCMEFTKLRDFYAVATYHATLTLFVFGMLVSNTARRSRAQTPISGPRASLPSQPDTASTYDVLIDGEDDKAARAFRHLGHGRPCLSSGSAGAGASTAATYCPLENAKGVMLVAADVLRGNFPRSDNGLPPLVENLVNLMTDLSKLSGRVST